MMRILLVRHSEKHAYSPQTLTWFKSSLPGLEPLQRFLYLQLLLSSPSSLPLQFPTNILAGNWRRTLYCGEIRNLVGEEFNINLLSRLLRHRPSSSAAARNTGWDGDGRAVLSVAQHVEEGVKGPVWPPPEQHAPSRTGTDLGRLDYRAIPSLLDRCFSIPSFARRPCASSLKRLQFSAAALVFDVPAVYFVPLLSLWVWVLYEGENLCHNDSRFAWSRSDIYPGFYSAFKYLRQVEVL